MLWVAPPLRGLGKAGGSRFRRGEREEGEAGGSCGCLAGRALMRPLGIMKL